MNTTFGEAFALWFYMTWRSLLVYIIVFSFYLFVDWRIGLSTMIFVNAMVKLLYAFTVVTFFVSQIYYLRKGIEEYYKEDLD